MSESTSDRRQSLAARMASILLLPLERLKGAVLKRGRPRRMVLMEALELGNRRQLFLVACDDQRFLVGAGRDRVRDAGGDPGDVFEDRARGSFGGDSSAVWSASGEGCAGVGERPATVVDGAGCIRRSGRQGLELVRRENLAAYGTAGRKEFEAGTTP